MTSLVGSFCTGTTMFVMAHLRGSQTVRFLTGTTMPNFLTHTVSPWDYVYMSYAGGFVAGSIEGFLLSLTFALFPISQTKIETSVGNTERNTERNAKRAIQRKYTFSTYWIAFPIYFLANVGLGRVFLKRYHF